MAGRVLLRLSVIALLLLAGCGSGAPLLAIPGLGDPKSADWSALPRLPTEGGVVFRGVPGAGFNIHNYLHHDGKRLRVMWTTNAVHEGEAGSRVVEAFSEDGLNWSVPSAVTPAAPYGQRFFARGYWLRGDGELMALVSQDREGDYFGPDLKMLAFVPDGAGWRLKGRLTLGTIINYPPRRLAGGDWLESTRASDMRVGFIRGGVSAWDDWAPIAVPAADRRLEWRLWPETPVERRPAGEQWKSWIRLPLPTLVAPRLDEPVWWALPDGRLLALFRDNSHGGRLYHAMGRADGGGWSKPAPSNFPDATSKMAGLRLSNGLYVLVSNPRPVPASRNPLVLSVSRDGERFVAMAILRDAPTTRRLFGRRKTPGYQYPQLLEREGRLYVAYSRNKEDIEVLRVRMEDIVRLLPDR